MTPLEIREKGYQVLFEHLGEVTTVRFLKDMGWGIGDYTQERPSRLGNATRQDFWRDVEKIRQEKRSNI
ncbi:hypothetical protein GFS31_04420 [Leptolyngbya sp. BL0902]|uniref:hypothetical protein n=1 Tax=Leptolyngbya sp. BL0902 TaxID=1115757 RepID=UPI0018E89251|nr:hypothetical protein [Leptolyngbya sp. BL0902]QQE63773.1 hypothetical protein GFS31_04420 [Leptolyngbya sp. BL0902]